MVPRVRSEIHYRWRQNVVRVRKSHTKKNLDFERIPSFILELTTQPVTSHRSVENQVSHTMSSPTQAGRMTTGMHSLFLWKALGRWTVPLLILRLNFKGLLFEFNFFVLLVWLNVSAQIPFFLMILTTMVSSKGKREWKWSEWNGDWTRLAQEIIKCLLLVYEL